MLHFAIALMEKGWAPDALIRMGIRGLVKQRLREEKSRQNSQTELVDQLKKSPIALHTQKANEQHYELPCEFFLQALGRHLKYSCCYFPEGVQGLDEAEAAMLALTCERSELEDGMKILELGCGWGSLTLWMAKHYPQSAITAVSNSSLQRQFILERAQAEGLHNIEVITCDMNDFATEEQFQRVVSVEMFEHMRNYQKLLKKIASWLDAGGKLFVHVFTHQKYAYPFETEGADNWLGNYFFTGGLMPSEDLLLNFQEDVVLEKQWKLNGQHYQKTAQAWLNNMDNHRQAIRPLFDQTYGAQNAVAWWNRWRVFFLACTEVWGYSGGTEWGVCHYLFQKRSL